MSLIALLEQLDKHKVNYCLVGGFAAMAHGSHLVTTDVDVACSMKPENLEKLFHAVAPYQPKHRMAKPPTPFTIEDARSHAWRNVYLRTDLGQLDCLGEVKGIGDFDEIMKSCVELEMETFQLKVISLDALIEAKEAMGRPRDLENVRILRAIRERQSRD